MFRSKRSGLIRRLWRSRLITDRDGDDGSKRSKGCRDCSCGSNPEKIPRTELWSITRSDQGTLGEACSGTLPVGSSDNGRYVMCVSEHRGAQEQHNDNKTMTCCLFREREPRPRSQTPDQGETSSCPVGEQEVKNVTYAFLKRLREKLLDLLVEAVESKGGMPSECVLVSQTELWLGGHLISPHFLLCKLYRWTDLPLTARLKALFYCQSFGMSESAMVCCNPYHYSRMCGPDSPPPPYSRLSYSDEHKPLDSDSTLFFTEAVGPPIPPVGPLIPPVGPPIPPVTPRVFTNTGTSHDSSTSESQRFHWCSVAYWEHRTRVGRLYPAHDSSLSIFYDLPQGTGLCLGQLNGNAYQDNNHRSRSHGSSGDNSRGSCVQRTRSKIGYGIVLSQEQDGVWVYNRSQHPVFAHSPTLDLPNSRGLLVKRVMPGFSLKVFDYERSSWILKHGIEPELQEGPYDPLSVRISFAKGWGPCYSRQFITSCPCWLEVLLSKQR